MPIGFGYGFAPDLIANALVEDIEDRRETTARLVCHPLRGWTTTDGMSFGIRKMAAIHHEEDIRDQEEADGSGILPAWIGLGWAGMQRSWANHMKWMDLHDYKVWRMWQSNINSRGIRAKDSRDDLIMLIMIEKVAERREAEQLADRLIAMSDVLDGNTQGRVNLQEETTTTVTTTTVTTQQRYDAANNFVNAMATSNQMPVQQVAQIANEMRTGQKDEFVRQQLVPGQTGAGQPAFPAPPRPMYAQPLAQQYTQPVYTPPPQTPMSVSVAPQYSQPQHIQQGSGGSAFSQTTTTTSSTTQIMPSHTSIAQGGYGQVQTPGFPSQAYQAPLQNPPAQQYLPPNIQPLQITQGQSPGQVANYSNPQYHHQTQPQQQMVHAGQAQSYPPQGSPQPMSSSPPQQQMVQAGQVQGYPSQGYQQPMPPQPQHGYGYDSSAMQSSPAPTPAQPTKKKKKKSTLPEGF